MKVVRTDVLVSSDYTILAGTPSFYVMHYCYDVFITLSVSRSNVSDCFKSARLQSFLKPNNLCFYLLLLLWRS